MRQADVAAAHGGGGHQPSRATSATGAVGRDEAVMTITLTVS